MYFCDYDCVTVARNFLVQYNSSIAASTITSIRLQRHISLGPGKIPIFCVHFSSPITASLIS